MKNSFSIDTIIIGAGPCGITLANLLADSIDFKVLVSLNNSRWINISESTFGKNSSNKAPVFKTDREWGNQHDTNLFQDFNVSSSLSDLKSIFIDERELKTSAEVISKLGWPNAIYSKSSQEKLRFIKRKIIKLHSNENLIDMRAKIENDVIYYSKLNLLHKKYGKYFLKVDGRLFICSRLVFATGGKNNFGFGQAVIDKYYPDLKTKQRNLGRGYSNHPKAIIANVELKKFVRYKEIRLTRDHIYSWSKFYREGQFSFRLFPRKVFSTGIFGKFESLIIALGYAKNFSVMIYCESPVKKRNTIKVTSCDSKVNDFLINYKLNEEFLSIVVKFQMEVLKFIETMAPIKSFTASKIRVEELMKDQYHYFGTTRMGYSFSDSVVNYAGKMHGTNGVYFVGTSVLPIARFEHPTFFAMVLSVFTSKALIADQGT